MDTFAKYYAKLADYMDVIKDFVTQSNYAWIFVIFLVVFFTLLLNYLEVRFYRKLQVKLERTKTVWDDSFAWAIHKPLGFFIWLFGLTLAAKLAVDLHFPGIETNPLLAYIVPIRRVGSVILLAWIFIRLSSKIEDYYSAEPEGPQNKPIDVGTVHAIAKLAKISILITTGLIIMKMQKIDIGPILALGGAGTVILGFASKDLLANFFGAMMVYLDRPFIVGDIIKSPDRNIEGKVEYIGWRLTRIRTYEKRPLYVPNSIFNTVAIENVTRMSHRRMKEFVGIRYEDINVVEDVAADIKKMIQNHPDVDRKMDIQVCLHQFGDSSLDILIFAFIKTTKWVGYMAVRQDIMLKVMKIIDKHGADMAFPTTTIDLPKPLALER